MAAAKGLNRSRPSSIKTRTAIAKRLSAQTAAMTTAAVTEMEGRHVWFRELDADRSGRLASDELLAWVTHRPDAAVTVRLDDRDGGAAVTAAGGPGRAAVAAAQAETERRYGALIEALVL